MPSHMDSTNIIQEAKSRLDDHRVHAQDQTLGPNIYPQSNISGRVSKTGGSDEDDNPEDPEGGVAKAGGQGGLGNKQVTSRFRGVCWNKKNKRWQAVIHSNGKYVYLGSFTSEDEAGRAFDMAAIKIRGSKTKLNFQYADYVDEHGRLIEDDKFPMIAALQPGSDRVRGGSGRGRGAGGAGHGGGLADGSRMLDGSGLAGLGQSPLMGYGGGLKMLGGGGLGGGYQPVMVGGDLQILPSAAAAAVSAGVHVEGVVPSGVREDLYGMVYRLPSGPQDKTCCAILDRGITNELGTYLHLEDAKQACTAGLALYLRLQTQVEHLGAQLAAARSHTMLPQGLGLGGGESVQHFQYIPMTVLQPESQHRGQGLAGLSGGSETVQHFQYVPMAMMQSEAQRNQPSSPQMLPIVTSSEGLRGPLPSVVDTASLGELRGTAAPQMQFHEGGENSGSWRGSGGMPAVPESGEHEEGANPGMGAMAGLSRFPLRDQQWLLQQAREEVENIEQPAVGTKRRLEEGDAAGAAEPKRQQIGGDAFPQDFSSMSKLLGLPVAEVQRVILSNNS